MKKISKRWFFVAGALLLALILWGLFRQTPVSVEVGVAKMGPMSVSIEAEGKTRVREKYTVTAPVSGRMSRIAIREGQSIPRDFIITTIDPSPPQRPIAPSESEKFKNPYGVKVFSPVSGRVLRVIEKSERIVAAGTPLVEIGDPEDIEVVIDILSTQATRIDTGAKVTVENWGGTDILKGRVRSVEPQAKTKISALGVEEQRVDVIADLTGKDLPRLGDNYRLDVKIISWESDRVLKIASSALFREGEKWKVFVVNRGSARTRVVTVGHRNPFETEIKEGLEEGERVVLHPPNSLTDGSSVSVR